MNPGFVLFATAVLAPILRGTAQKVVLVAGCVAAVVSWELLDLTTRWSLDVGNLTLSVVRVDPLSLVFGLVFVLITLVGIVHALHNDNGNEHASTLVYAGSSLGVVFAGDWVSLFVFWELMAVSSLFVIWHGGTERAAAAGYRYILVHIFGGSLLFAGILLHLADGGNLGVTTLTSADTATGPLAFWLILSGVLVNAAMPPLHAWLTDSYPEASITGSVFLSAFTTKTAVYVLIRVFPGTDALVWSGCVMAVYGVVYAVIENDIRRLLAYHIVSQVGYMVAGVGLGTPLSLDGAAAHAYSHILYKALLFMTTGAVLYATGFRKLTELGGIAARMKLVLILYMVGAFSISGVPLFNGFISKSMIVSGAVEAHLPLAELMLHLASIGTFLTWGLKVPYFAFLGPKKDIEVRPIPSNMIVAMSVGAILCTAYGVVPSLLYDLLPYGSDYHPFTIDHLVSGSQLLIGTALGFWLVRDKLKGKATINLDTDWFYRRPLATLGTGIVDGVRWAGENAAARSRDLAERLWYFSQHPTSVLDAFRAFDTRADRRPDTDDPYRFRTPIGHTVFWVVVYFALVALAAFLAL